MSRSRAIAHTKPWRALLVGHTAWLALAVMMASGLALYAWPFTVDDAFITARYARNLALQGTYGFDVSERSDGITGPLWLLPQLLAVSLRGDPLLVAKLVAVACTLVTLRLMQRHARAMAQGSVVAPVALLLAASSTPLTIWSVGGLETAAACLATSVLVFEACAARPKVGAVGMAGAALAWLRPELAVLVGVSLAWLALRLRWRAAPAVALVVASAVALLSFRLVYFGRPLPLSAVAKPAELPHGVRYLLDSLRPTASLGLLPLVVCALRCSGRRERLLACAIGSHGLAVLLAGGDWMPSARLLVPIVPAVCLLAARGFALTMLRNRWLAQLLLLLALATRVVTLVAELPRARASAAARERTIPALLLALAPLRDPIVALDIGALGYFSGRRFIDLGGLTDVDVALSPGGHVAKRIDSAWLAQKRPGAIVLHSRDLPRVDASGQLRWFAGYPVERNVLAMRWVLERYRVRRVIEHDRKYFYVILAPR